MIASMYQVGFAPWLSTRRAAGMKRFLIIAGSPALPAHAATCPWQLKEFRSPGNPRRASSDRDRGGQGVGGPAAVVAMAAARRRIRLAEVGAQELAAAGGGLRVPHHAAQAILVGVVAVRVGLHVRGQLLRRRELAQLAKAALARA